VLKKSGWKEGTGLRAQEKVCVLILASSGIAVSYFHSTQNLMLSDFSGIYVLCCKYGIVINVVAFLHIRPRLVPPPKVYTMSHRMFGHMHEVLNKD
jgi:hypothetical protein